MPDLTYSKLIAFRVTHPDPHAVNALAQVFKEEISKAFARWVQAIPDPKPEIEAFTVGAEDFPFQQVPS